MNTTALSTNCETVPDGLMQVIAVDCGMPKSLAIFLLVSTATSFNSVKVD